MQDNEKMTMAIEGVKADRREIEAAKAYNDDEMLELARMQYQTALDGLEATKEQTGYVAQTVDLTEIQVEETAAQTEEIKVAGTVRPSELGPKDTAGEV
jgi:hypothetical protein